MAEDTTITIIRVAILISASVAYYFLKDKLFQLFSTIFLKGKNHVITNDNDIDDHLPCDDQSDFSKELDLYMEQLMQKGAFCPEPSLTAISISDQIAEESACYFDKVQNDFVSKYSFGDRWNYDQEKAELTFYKNETLIFKAKAQILGSYSHNSHTWLWSLFNESITDSAQENLFTVWHTMLTLEELFPIAYEVKSEGYLHKMLSIAIFISQAKAAYIAKNEKTNSETYFIITEIQFPDN